MGWGFEFWGAGLPPAMLAAAAGVSLLAGLVKGMVGFAMPMIMISILGSVMAPDLALAALILPTLLANLWQALRQGPGAACRSLRRFRVFLIAGGILLLASAQLVGVLPGAVLLLLLGVPMTAFALATLAGRGLRLGHATGPRTEAALGAIAGFFGGISGVWGPPTVAMLVARDTDKAEQIRVQGVVYAMGSVLLTAAHLGSGVLSASTLPLSLAMVPPALAGMAAGFAIQDRIDQRVFRRATLAVLLVAGLNLVRRGLLGL